MKVSNLLNGNCINVLICTLNETQLKCTALAFCWDGFYQYILIGIVDGIKEKQQSDSFINRKQKKCAITCIICSVRSAHKAVIVFTNQSLRHASLAICIVHTSYTGNHSHGIKWMGYHLPNIQFTLDRNLYVVLIYCDYKERRAKSVHCVENT